LFGGYGISCPLRVKKSFKQISESWPSSFSVKEFELGELEKEKAKIPLLLLEIQETYICAFPGGASDVLWLSVAILF